MLCTAYENMMIRSNIAYGFAALCLYGCTGEFPVDAPKLQAAEQAYDGELLVKSLNEIDAWHVEHDTGVANVLGAGNNPLSIEAEFANLDCRLTDELKALWSWCDGGVASVPFVWYHDFLSLQEALSEYRWLRLIPSCDGIHVTFRYSRSKESGSPPTAGKVPGRRAR